jgi:DNA-binding transcriptional ArsR family regulator
MYNKQTPLFWAFCVFYLSLYWYLPQTQNAQSRGVFAYIGATMSIRLMSAIFETEFRDLQDEDENTTKASTAKLVLLAMADHANDEGEGSYPSIENLCRKTALSAQTIRNTWDALRYNGIISLRGPSKYMTNDHTINTSCFPKLRGENDAILLLQPIGGGSNR